MQILTSSSMVNPTSRASIENNNNSNSNNNNNNGSSNNNTNNNNNDNNDSNNNNNNSNEMSQANSAISIEYPAEQITSTIGKLFKCLNLILIQLM